MNRLIIPRSRPLYIGGKLHHVLIVNGKPCMRRKCGNKYLPVPIGGGFFDSLVSVVSSIASNPIAQKIGHFAIDQGIKKLSGGGVKNNLSKQQLLSEISKVMSSHKKRL